MKFHFWLLLGLWTVAIIVLFSGDYWHLGQTMKEVALIESRAYLKKDQAIRRWAASHGGVYVPVSEKTPANPYLTDVPERDIRTPKGQSLTLMNPAYMVRQLMRDYEQQHHVRGHITSLKYFRQETAPDVWEKSALVAFQDGMQEVCEFTDLHGESYLRIMTPLTTEARCLKCHAAQGYQLGDIRGGISLALPMEPYWGRRRKEMTAHAFSFGLLWLIGGLGFRLAASKLTRAMKKRDEAEALLDIAKDNYQTLIENAQTGIYISQGNTIKFCNAKFAEIHGYSQNRLIGMNPAGLVHPRDRNRVARLHGSRMRGLQVPEAYETQCITAEGRSIWVQRRNTLIKFDGRPAVLGNEIDITQKRQTESELKASEKQLKRFAAKLVQHQEDERKTIALEIHEDIAQSLSAIKLSIEASLISDARPPTLEPQVMAPVIEQINGIIDLIRRLTKRLSPVMMDTLGLKTTVNVLCREVMTSRPGSGITSRIAIDEGRVPGLLKIVVYRVLEDILKHMIGPGCENRCTVSLTACGDNLELAVHIAGLRAPSSVTVSGWDMQLLEIKNCTESFGGSLKIETGEKNCCVITACWPLADHSLSR